MRRASRSRTRRRCWLDDARPRALVRRCGRQRRCWAAQLGPSSGASPERLRLVARRCRGWRSRSANGPLQRFVGHTRSSLRSRSVTPGSRSGDAASACSRRECRRALRARSGSRARAAPPRRRPCRPGLGEQVGRARAACRRWPARRRRATPACPSSTPTGTSISALPYSSCVAARARSAAAACRPCAPAPRRQPSSRASAPASMNPRASTPATRSTPGAPGQLGQRVDARAEAARVGQQRRDVLEDDAGLREVRHVAQPGRDRPRRRVGSRRLGVGHGRLRVPARLRRAGRRAAAPAPRRAAARRRRAARRPAPARPRARPR